MDKKRKIQIQNFLKKEGKGSGIVPGEWMKRFLLLKLNEWKILIDDWTKRDQVAYEIFKYVVEKLDQ